MSSFKNFQPLLSSLQDQADGKGTIAGSPLEDFLSIAGYETPAGGGGGGDYSLGAVQIVNNSESNRYNLGGGFQYEAGELGEGSPACVYTALNSEPQTTVEGNLILYKGTAYCQFVGGTPSYTLSGDIEEAFEGLPDVLLVTGDGTITITA